MAFTPRAGWQLPYAALAPWNIPTHQYVGMDPTYLGYMVEGYPGPGASVDINGKTGYDYCWRHYYYSANAAPTNLPNFNCSALGYTYPIYFTSDANDTYTIVGGYNNLSGTTIPWNSSWLPGDPQCCAQACGTCPSGENPDAQIIVLGDAADANAGKEWNLWKVWPDTANKKLYVRGGSLVGTGTTYPGPTLFQPGDWRTKAEGWYTSRGCGIQYGAMLVTPEDIYSGRIKHGLSMPIANPDPYSHLSPATKTEGNVGATTSLGSIPEGMRFSLYSHAWGADLGNWVDQYHGTKSQAIQDFALIVATALRDYGWFITDTSGGATWQFESVRSAGSKWLDLGINWGTYASPNTTIRDLMDHLLIPATLQDYNDPNWVEANFQVCTTPENYLGAITLVEDGVAMVLEDNFGKNVSTTSTGLEINGTFMR